MRRGVPPRSGSAEKSDRENDEGTMRVTIVGGTNRCNSVTGQLAVIAGDVYSALGVTVAPVDLCLLPPEILDPAIYAMRKRPPVFEPFLSALIDADAALFIVPEYNGGLPGVLKLFIDLVPDCETILAARPVALVGLAAGEWGGMRPLDQLSAILTYRKAFVYPERVYISNCTAAVNGGPLAGPVRQRLTDQAERFLSSARAVSPLRTLFPRRAPANQLT